MLYDMNRARKFLLTIKLIAYSIHVELQSELSFPSFFSYRRFKLNSTHIDLFAAPSLQSRLIPGHQPLSRIRSDKNHLSACVPHSSFRKTVNSNRSIVLKGLGRAIQARSSLNDVEKEIKNHSPFVVYCLNMKEEEDGFFFLSKNIIS